MIDLLKAVSAQLMVGGAVFQRIAPETTLHAAWGLGFAWLLSMACADMFHRWVELPLERVRKFL